MDIDGVGEESITTRNPLTRFEDVILAVTVSSSAYVEKLQGSLSGHACIVREALRSLLNC